jgi:hypothetical protein
MFRFCNDDPVPTSVAGAHPDVQTDVNVHSEDEWNGLSMMQICEEGISAYNH